MTRKEIEAQCTIDKHGIIRDPGKFESEYVYAPYFYDATIDGCAEELSYMEDGAGEYVALVAVSDEDRAEFPEIDKDTAFILVTESEQGFVHVKELTEDQAEYERSCYEEDDSESIRCDQCEAHMINGVFCHETGCRNANRRYDSESDEWVKQRQCFDCGCTVDADDPCCSAID